MQLYTYELSFFEDETATFIMLDSGLYVMNKYVERYWQDKNRCVAFTEYSHTSNS